MAPLQTVFRAPVFADDAEKTKKAGQLTIILWVASGVLTLINLTYLLPDYKFSSINWILSVTTVFMLGLIWLAHRGHVTAVTYLFLTGIYASLIYQAWQAEGIRDITYISLFAVVLIAALLTGWRSALFFAALSLIAGWVLALAEANGVITPTIGNISAFARDVTGVYIIFGLLLYLTINSLENALEAARKSNDELQRLSTDLERRVTERTRDLALAAEVARSVSHFRDLSELLSQAVDLIQARFQLYYAQIYLADNARETLVLRSGTGDAGRLLLARQHKLPINERSINGKAAATEKPVLVADTTKEPLFRPNPFLPRTRAEVAIPLLVGDRLVGVLNMQHDQPEAFTEDNLPALTSLAGQLAVAIENASLFSERKKVEEELTKFKLGIDYTSSAVFLTDVAGTIEYVNPGFEKLYGWSREEAIGQTPRILKSGFITQEQYAHFWQTLLNKGVVAGEIINKTKDGRLVHVDGSNNPIVNAEGVLVGFLSVHTDISQRKTSEAQLERSIAELNCLNDIGRKVEEHASIPEFLEWVAQRVPQAMPFAKQCVAAIALGGAVYGDERAMKLPRHIIEGLRLGGELIGRLYIAYEDTGLSFEDEDSSFIGGIGRRISSYIESQNLLEQVQKRAAEMQTVAQVGTAVAGNLDTAQLLQNVVDLTKDRFKLYHAHIYLLNEVRDTLVLTAGAGEAGKAMIIEGRSILLRQERSLVARAARLRQGVIVNDVQAEPGFLPHPLLPDTRSELAVPLMASDRVLGVLDVQADKANYFSQEDINTYTTLATQVAAALQKAQQFEQTQLALEELRVLQQTFVREGWESFFENEEREVQGFAAVGKEVKPIVRNGRSAQEPVLTLAELTAAETAVIKPVRLSGTNIGGLGVRLPANGKLTTQQRLLLEALTLEVSQALERARLSEQTQIALSETEKRTQELAILNEMAQRLTAQTKVTDVLNVIHEYTARLMASEEFYVAFYYADTDEVEFALAVTHENIYRNYGRRRTGNGITEYIIRQRQPLLIRENVEQHLASLGIEVIGSSAQSWMGAPLLFGDSVIGVIALQSYSTPRVYNQQHLNLLLTIASQAAIAIENAKLIEATEQRARQEQILRQVSTRVNAAVDPESILRTAAQEVGRALGLETFVYLTETNQSPDPLLTAVEKNGR